jgi:hypothetical protein
MLQFFENIYFKNKIKTVEENKKSFGISGVSQFSTENLSNELIIRKTHGEAALVLC